MRRDLRFPVGKLPPATLASLLARCPVPRRSRVVIGPRLGEDAAVIDFGSKFLVAKTDPITFTAEHIGWYAVNVNANDIATLGARPRWFLATLLLPEGKTNETLAGSIFSDILNACQTLGVTLCGGHTEITAGLETPIVVGQMLGEVEKSKLVRKQRQRPGDVVILTKGLAVEGTAILAREKSRELSARLGRRLVRRARRLLFNPGISVVREAMLAVRSCSLHAMHDPTEGGLLAGLYELARSGSVGLRVWKERIPLLSETQALRKVMGFDPYSLIASGALLIVTAPQSAPRLLRNLRRHGVVAAVIGEIRPEKEGLWVVDDDRLEPLRVPERDEIARLLG